MKALDVVTAVRRHYGCEKDNVGPEWAALTEFCLRPGAQAPTRIDLFMVRAWSGRPKGHERHAIEVKVSRSDLLAELRQPHKRDPFHQVAHRFMFATPAGLVRDGELPDDCGLLEVSDRGCTVTVRGPRRDEPDPMPDTAFVEAFRRASRSEARIRTADTGAAYVARMEEHVAHADAATLRAQQARDVANRRVAELLRAVADDFTVACTECRTRLTARRGRHGSIEWTHTTEALALCRWPHPDYETVERRPTEENL